MNQSERPLFKAKFMKKKKGQDSASRETSKFLKQSKQASSAWLGGISSTQPTREPVMASASISPRQGDGEEDSLYVPTIQEESVSFGIE